MDGALVPTTWDRGGHDLHVHAPPAPRREHDFTLFLSGVRTADGEVLAPVVYKVHTVSAPKVVRVRPATKSTGVERTAKISVRFNQPMDKAATKEALSVKVNGKAIKGKVSFTKSAKQLTFKPKKAFPYLARVTVTIDARATSSIGTPINKKTTTSSGERKPPVASAADGGGQYRQRRLGRRRRWAAVERYYLGLMNCTRTGGWVTSSGSCSSPGGRNVAPLRLDSGISIAWLGRMPGSSPGPGSAATTRTAARTTDCGARAIRHPTGARTSAAVVEIHTQRSLPRTSSTRASGRTTAVTTAI